MLSDQERKRQFLACLLGMLLLAISTGCYRVLTVAYLEHSRMPVNQIGTVMASLSLVEAISALGTGFLLHGRGLRARLVVPAVVQSVSAAILAFQPSGWPILLSAWLHGIGIGAVGVPLCTTAMQRRPSTLGIGLAMGWYTGCIAAGNGMGSLLAGIVSDNFGFTAGFLTSASTYLFMGLVLALLPPEPARVSNVAVDGDPTQATSGARGGPVLGPWVVAVIAAFTLASLNSSFETLFPIFCLRTDLTLTNVGFLSGIKAFMAAVIRPLSGFIVARLSAPRLNLWTILGLAAASAMVPHAGQAGWLAALMAVMGITFGLSRSVSATLVLEGQQSQAVANRRIGIYNSVLCLGNITGPWTGGWLASWLDLPAALSLLPAILITVFISALLALPYLAAVTSRFRRNRLPAQNR